MKTVFIIDEISSLKVATDTSLLFMQEACKRDHQVYAVTPQGMFFDGELKALAVQVEVNLSEEPVFEVANEGILNLKDADLCFIRKDPPVDDRYVAMLQLLSSLERTTKTIFVNPPAAVLRSNEKLYCLDHPEAMPRTLISSDIQRILDTVASSLTPMVIKPTNEFGSRGIYILQAEDKNLKALVNSATNQGQDYVIVQEFLEDVFHGDKRVFFLEGKVVGVVSRVPQDGEFRCAVSLGSKLKLTSLTEAESRICEDLGKTFLRDGMIFVGIDIIGGRLIEMNVTSPTLVRQFNELAERNLEKELFDVLEEKTQRKG